MVEEGVRDEYLTRLREEREVLRAMIDQLRARIDVAKLEDQAQASLSAQEQLVLREAGLLDKEDLTQLQAERQELVARRQALVALINAVSQASAP